MPVHKDRAKKRAEHSNPINYTCGECRQVHKFDKKHPYICEDNIKKNDNREPDTEATE